MKHRMRRRSSLGERCARRLRWKEPVFVEIVSAGRFCRFGRQRGSFSSSASKAEDPVFCASACMKGSVLRLREGRRGASEGVRQLRAAMEKIAMNAV
jgi:hypothetical protein